jgi:hypothetical protein
MGPGEEARTGCRVSSESLSCSENQPLMEDVELFFDRLYGQLYVELLRLHARETGGCHGCHD